MSKFVINNGARKSYAVDDDPDDLKGRSSNADANDPVCAAVGRFENSHCRH